MHAIICNFDFVNSMLFTIKFKPILKFTKFGLHNYGLHGPV